MIEQKIDWREQAVKLANTGVMSRREIAEFLGVKRSTCLDYLRAYYKAMGDVQEDEGVVEVKGVTKTVQHKPSPGEHDNSRILWISDLHSPWENKGALQFLKDLKEEYNPTRIICGGDEADLQSINMHGQNPDMPSAGDELEMVKKFIKQLGEIFPVMDILESNHTSLAYRRAFKAGISKGYMKSYTEMFEAPEGWVWHDDLMIKLPNGQDCYFCHGKSADGLKLSRNMACNVVQGHFHSKFAIQYWSNPNNLFWSMQAGCLVDDKSMAMAYNKLTMDRPIIGTGLIIDSVPILKAMKL